MKVRGRVAADLEIAGERMRGDFLVADISPEGILGADILRENGILVDMNKQRILWERRCRPTTSPETNEG